MSQDLIEKQSNSECHTYMYIVIQIMSDPRKFLFFSDLVAIFPNNRFNRCSIGFAIDIVNFDDSLLFICMNGVNIFYFFERFFEDEFA